MYPEWIRKWEAYEEELSLDLRAASPLLASAGQGSWGIGPWKTVLIPSLSSSPLKCG